MNAPARDRTPLHRTARRLALVWIALIMMLLASLGSAYLPLGRLAWVPGIAIAAVKAAFVARWFMQIGRSAAWSRIACVAALCALVLLCTLTYFEGAMRPHDPAPWQQPRQLPATRAPSR